MANRSTSAGAVWKGIAAGALGGLAASCAMNLFQQAVPAKTVARLMGEQPDNGSNEGGSDESEPTTVEAAEAISEDVFDHTLTKSEKKTAGPAVHFALGTSAGALYGGLAEVAPVVRAGFGTGFGTVFWVAADEAAVPALGLSEAPRTFPPSTHVYAFVSHLVYGVTTELVRRAVRAAV